MKLLTPLFALVILAGCATFDGKDDSVKMRAYAVLSDYDALSATALVYVTSPNPNPLIKQRVKTADAKAYPAVEVLAVVAKGQVPLFCETVAPADIAPALAQAACDSNLPSVVNQTRALITVLATVLRETAQ